MKLTYDILRYIQNNLNKSIYELYPKGCKDMVCENCILDDTDGDVYLNYMCNVLANRGNECHENK